jgi:hypothetical protein
MPDSEQERDLEVLLSYLLNRTLKQADVIAALGISRSAYNDQRREGRLTNPANLISAAKHFHINPLELLMQYNYVDIEHVHDVWRNWESYITHRSDPTMTATRGVATTTTLNNRVRNNKRHLSTGI